MVGTGRSGLYIYFVVGVESSRFGEFRKRRFCGKGLMLGSRCKDYLFLVWVVL